MKFLFQKVRRGLNLRHPGIFLPILLLANHLLSVQSYSAVQYSCRVWQSDDGLPQNSVQTILQTSDGYLWVGTQEGLARFDGVKFTTFDQKSIPEFHGRWITASYESRDGSLWIGTDGQGLARLKGGKWTHYNVNNGLPNSFLRAICETRDGTLWIGSVTGLIRFKDGQFSILTEEHGLAQNTVRAICEGQDGSLWIATGAGLNRLKDGVISNEAVPTGLLINSLRALCMDREGNLWIGSNGGLSVRRNGSFTTYTQKDGLVDSTVSSILEDRQGQLWIGTLGGLNRLSGGKLIAEKNDRGGFYDLVYSIFEDREGNIWVGSKGGLNRLNPKRFVSITKEDGLSHNTTVSVLEDNTGTLWIGTWGGGLNSYRDGKITTVTSPGGRRSDLVLGIHQGRSGSLWVGFDFERGFNELRDGHWLGYDEQVGFTDPAVYAIHEDTNQTLWLGTRTALVSFKDEKFTRYTREEGLAGNSVHTIHEDKQGTLWFGTSEGLSRRRNDQFENFTKTNGLSHDSILALYEDRERRLWIGTRGGGLNCFYQGQFIACTTAEGLFHDTIFEILEDDHGYLWMSCPKGIFRVRKKELDDFVRGDARRIASFAYGSSDGLVSTECKGVAKPGGWKSKDGRLWFPTAKGLVGVEPNLRINELPPSVIIEKVIADRKIVEDSRMGDGKEPSDVHQSASSSLYIQPGRGELEIHYTALSFQAAEKNRFKYKLEGFDPDWVDVGTRRAAYYNNLAPRTYRFRVIACNNDGIWNEIGASMGIVVQPHFWQTWWFMACTGIAAFGLVGSGVRYATRRKMKRKLLKLQQQHAIEQERARIAKDIHDDLGSSLTRITMLGERAEEDLSKPDELKTHVGKMVGFARDSVRSLDEIVWAVNPENDRLESLADYISHYADEFFENTSVRCRLEMPMDLPSRQLSSEVRHNLFLVVKEALNNTLKYANASDVCIRMPEDDSILNIIVEDNGCGFAVSEKLNENRGNGLRNMRKRMESVGGRFSVESEPGKGTKIILSISIGEKTRAPADLL